MECSFLRLENEAVAMKVLDQSFSMGLFDRQLDYTNLQHIEVFPERDLNQRATWCWLLMLEYVWVNSF